MMLVRLSGHSGAGKSRLVAALPRFGIDCQRTLLYTSRRARDGELHGKDYYFLSRSAISALPSQHFYVGPVREMLQAVDLAQLETDLRSNNVVIVELFFDLWARLIKRLEDRLGCPVPSASIFMTAIDPQAILAMPEASRPSFIESEVARILTARGKDEPEKVTLRARSAVGEILTAIGPDGCTLYSRVLHSSPEGPDGQDEWTSQPNAIGRAKQAIDEFVDFYKSLAQ